MIRFACRQCGKTDQRPDDQAGSLVFCTCGLANRVPWESTVAAPESAPAGRDLPQAFPMPGEDRRQERPRRPRWKELPQPDPAYCLNHPEVARHAGCADCGRSFCENCLVILQNQALCAPCKNLRLRRLQRPPRMSVFGILSLVLALLGAPVAFWLTIVGVGLQQGTATVVVMSAIGALLPAAGLLLGAMSLREIARQPRVAGRSLAMTGVVTGLAGILWCLTMIGIAIARDLVA